jgi:hypothetical protein
MRMSIAAPIEEVEFTAIRAQGAGGVGGVGWSIRARQNSVTASSHYSSYFFTQQSRLRQ